MYVAPASKGVQIAPKPPTVKQPTMKCPSGWVGSYPNCSPPPPTAAVGGGCPPGQARDQNGSCRPAPAAAAPAGGGGLNFSTPGIPAAGGGAAWSASAVERPSLTPIDPQAAYDPEIAAQLARQRSYTGDLKAGTGFAMDVLTGQQRDVNEAQMREAEQAAAQAGIPFDKARFLMEQQRGLQGAMATEKLGREQMVGQAIGAESGVAQGEAGERTERLGLDLKRDVVENELALDRYGRDIQKYGIDAQAATAANNSLMDFYSRLTTGAFSAIGNIGGNQSNSYSYGSY